MSGSDVAARVGMNSLLDPTMKNIDQSPVSLVNDTASELFHRELVHTGFLPEGASYSSRLPACM